MPGFTTFFQGHPTDGYLLRDDLAGLPHVPLPRGRTTANIPGWQMVDAQLNWESIQAIRCASQEFRNSISPAYEPALSELGQTHWPRIGQR
jgi:hypothetical protein